MVPTGTFSTIPSPSRPVFLEPSPCRPRWAVYSGLKRKCTSVLWRSLDSIEMSPPLPPSPPEGPPRGTNFSRRKAMQPLPPSPAFTRILASSINIECLCVVVWRGHSCPRNAAIRKTGGVTAAIRSRSKVSRFRLERKSLDSKPRQMNLPPSSERRGQTPSLKYALLCFDRLRLDHHKLSHRPFVEELDASGNLG